MSLPNELDVDLEMNKITLAAMCGEERLKNSIKTLVELYDVEVESPEPIDIAKDMQAIIIDSMEGAISEELRDERIKDVLKKALLAKDKPLGEAAGDCTQVNS